MYLRSILTTLYQDVRLIELVRKFRTENRVIYQASASHASHNDEHLAPSDATQSFHLLLANMKTLDNKNVTANRGSLIDPYGLSMRCHFSSSLLVDVVADASL